MALQTTRIDDLTGEPEATTVLITVNGRGVELDLAEKSAARLTKALEPFWNVGTEAAYTIERKRGNPGRTSKDKRGYDLDELRQWAVNNGVELPARGRIPQTIVDQFLRS